jgi:RNase H-like domain found in reverse transcriptase
VKIFKYPIIGPYTPLRTPRRTCQYLSGPEILKVRNYLPQYNVQEFTGFLNFYHRFIPNFSCITHPLYDLTKKGERFEWTCEHNEAFSKLKHLICSAPILTLAQDHGRFRIEADACNYATGAVLMQEQDGVYRPVAFYSKSLNDVERNYPIHDREMLAIMRALYEWCHYVIGQEFDIWSDHKNLSWFMEKQNLNRRQA